MFILLTGRWYDTVAAAVEMRAGGNYQTDQLQMKQVFLLFTSICENLDFFTSAPELSQ